MPKPHEDTLYITFDRLLKNPERKHQTEQQLLFDVVAEYIHFLMQMGNVPFSQLDHLEEFLFEEVTEIYRKKTYGSASLHEYQSKRSGRTRNRQK